MRAPAHDVRMAEVLRWSWRPKAAIREKTTSLTVQM
jgi:hypothetical protein